MLGEIIGYIQETGYVLIKGSDGDSYYCFENELENTHQQQIEIGMTLDFVAVNTGFERKASQGLVHTQYQFEVLSPAFITEGGLPDGLSLYYMHPVLFSATGTTKSQAEIALIDMARRCAINAILNQTVIKSMDENNSNGNYTAQGAFAIVTKRGFTVNPELARRQASILSNAINEAQRLTRRELTNRTQAQRKSSVRQSMFHSVASAIMGR